MRNAFALDILRDLRHLTANDALLIVCLSGCSWFTAVSLIRLAGG